MMEPTGAGPDRPLGLREARRLLGILLGGLALLLFVAFVKNALALRTIRRINDHGGMVIGYSDPLPLWSWWPARARQWIGDWVVLREEYMVAFDLHAAPCGVGETLRMFPTREIDPGDEGLAAVKDLGHVRSLIARNTSVTDAGLRAISNLRELERLNLEGTRVTGPGLAHLRGLPLRWLNLRRTPIDDAGLVYLDDLPALGHLDLQGTRIAGPGLAHLARFGALRGLNLADTPADDRGLRHLAALPLTVLVLNGTAVSDAGLDALAPMAGLISISLCGTRVTEEAARRSPVEAIRAYRCRNKKKP